MKKLFDLAAASVFGATVFFIPVPAQRGDKTNQPRYYFFSPTKLVRQMQSQGIMYSLHVDGIDIKFTDKNSTGIKPSWNARLVWAGFGRAPQETMIVVDRITFAEKEKLRGKKSPMVLTEATSVKEAPPRLMTSLKAMRPELPTMDSEQRKNLG
jgi:hypothetical protein